MENTIFNNRYRIIKFINSTTIANVYIGKDNISNKYITIKILQPNIIKDKSVLSHFVSDLKIINKLNNNNIVVVYDVGYEKGIYYIIMEYIDGMSLKEKINIEKNIQYKDATNIIIQICNTLESFHQNTILHRDLRPTNILFTKNNIVKISDFGISKFFAQETLSQSCQSVDSIYYSSPEQLSWLKIDERSDIYSIGLIFYEMLTGSLPFTDTNPSELLVKQIQEIPINPVNKNISIPISLGNIVLKMLEKKPESRYQSISELLQVLNNFLSDETKNIITLDTIPQTLDKTLPTTINFSMPNSPNQVSKSVNDQNDKFSNNNNFSTDSNFNSDNSNNKIEKFKNFYNTNKKTVLISSCLFALIFFILITFLIYRIEDNKISTDFVNEHNNKAEKYLNEYNFKNAEKELNQSFKKESTLKNTLPIGEAYNFKGLFYQKQLNYEEAEKNYKKALDILKDENNEEVLAQNYNNLIGLYSDLGQFKKAKSYITKSKNISKSNTLKAEYNYNLGNYYFKKGELKLAEKFFLKAYEYSKKNNVNIINSLNISFSIGEFYTEIYKYEEAENVYNYIKKSISKSFDENSFFEANLYANLGILNNSQGKYNEAEKYLDSSIEIIKNEQGESNFYISNLYNIIAKIYENQGQLKNSEKSYKNSLKITNSLYDNNHILIASSYVGLSDILTSKSKYKDAEKYLKDSLKIEKSIFGNDSLEISKLYLKLGNFYELLNDFNNSEKYFTECLKIRESILTEESNLLIDTYLHLGKYYCSQNNFDKGKKPLSTAVKIQEKNLGKKCIFTAFSYSYLAVCYYSRFPEYENEYKKYIDKSIVLSENLLEDINPEKIYRNYEKTSILIDNENYNKAENILLDILKIYDKEYNKNNPNYIRLYINLSHLYGLQNASDKSLEYLNKALNISKEIYGEETSFTANLYNLIAIEYLNIGNRSKSQKNYARSLSLYKKIYDTNIHLNIANLYSNLSKLYYNSKNYVKAEENSKIALDITKKLYGENHTKTADEYHNIGYIYVLKKDYNMAQNYLDKSLNIYTKFYGDYHHSIGRIHYEIAIICYYTNKKEEGKKHIEKSISIYEKIHGKNHRYVQSLRDEYNKYFK
ncbi:MAG: tetratricopeptide repeat protein [Clostridiales bacterium]